MCLSFITNFSNAVICGDFNAHHKIWNFNTPHKNGVSLLDFIEKNNYSLQNTFQPPHMIFDAGIICFLIDLTIIFPKHFPQMQLGSDWCFYGKRHRRSQGGGPNRNASNDKLVIKTANGFSVTVRSLIVTLIADHKDLFFFLFFWSSPDFRDKFSSSARENFFCCFLIMVSNQ